MHREPSLAPDVEKIKAFAASIRALKAPTAKHKDAKAQIAKAVAALGVVAADLDRWEA